MKRRYGIRTLLWQLLLISLISGTLVWIDRKFLTAWAVVFMAGTLFSLAWRQNIIVITSDVVSLYRIVPFFENKTSIKIREIKKVLISRNLFSSLIVVEFYAEGDLKIGSFNTGLSRFEAQDLAADLEDMGIEANKSII